MKDKADKEGLTNIYSQVDEAENTILCQNCADIIFFGNVLHDFRDPLKVLKNAKLMLKPTGYLANVDWKKEATDIGPPVLKRYSEEKAADMISRAGFFIERTKNIGLYHYLIMAKPI